MMVLGWITGLSCALFHSFCYLASKRHTVRFPGHSLDLLVQAHLLMSAAAVPLTVFLWPRPLPPLPELSLFLGGSALFYLGGQWFMVEAMRFTEPSRVSPLLGIKVLIMGGFATLALGATPSPLQWMALTLCTLGAISLGMTGTPLPGRAALRILLAAVCYVLSDSCIERLVALQLREGQPLFHAALFSLGLTYSFLGLIAMGFRLRGNRSGPHPARAVKEVAPFACFWLLAMAMFYTTLGQVGPVLGVALQSTRGILSVCLGAVAARMFHREQLEEPLDRKLFFKRLLAAVLMFGGMVLYTQAS